MLSTDREEFLKLLRVLFAGLDKPLGEAKEEAFWKSLAQMSLIEFGRCCDLVLQELGDGDVRKDYTRSFTPGHVWSAKRRLKSRASANEPSVPEKPWTGDNWDVRANHLLLGYLGDQARLGIYYSSVDEQGFHLTTEWKALPETEDLTRPLVEYKKAWAQDMRETDAEGRIPTAEEQFASFRECMRRADLEIDEVRSRYARFRQKVAA